MSGLPPEVLAEIDRLPPLPTSVLGVMQLLDDPSSSGQQVAAALGGDPVLTARVLRLANSAWYTWTRRVGTIQEAVILVGFAAVRSQVLAAAAYDVLRRGAPGYALDQELLWQHSVATGVAARFLAQRCKRDQAETAFVAGLLHDIGKVALGKSLGSRYEEVLRLAKEGTSFADAERAVLGCDHALVGAEAARRWNLPEALVEAIEYHHRPLELRHSGLADFVHVADSLVLLLGIVVGTDHLLYPSCDEVLARIGLAPEAVDEVLDRLSDLLADVSAPFEPGGARAASGAG